MSQKVYYPTISHLFDPWALEFTTKHRRVSFTPTLVEHHYRYERVLWAWDLVDENNVMVACAGHDGSLHDAAKRFDAFCARRLNRQERERELIPTEVPDSPIVIVAALTGVGGDKAIFTWVQTTSQKTAVQVYGSTFDTAEEACEVADTFWRGNAVVLNLAGIAGATA